ncbi:MAG: AMP nucleosidase, partial [Pseudomonadota bacterium]
MPNKTDWQKAASPAEAVDKLILFYSQSATALRKAFKAFVEEGRPPPGPGHFGYPSLRIVYAPDGVVPAISLAFGTLKTPGIYEADIAHPALY